MVDQPCFSKALYKRFGLRIRIDKRKKFRAASKSDASPFFVHSSFGLAIVTTYHKPGSTQRPIASASARALPDRRRRRAGKCRQFVGRSPNGAAMTISRRLRLSLGGRSPRAKQARAGTQSRAPRDGLCGRAAPAAFAPAWGKVHRSVPYFLGQVGGDFQAALITPSPFRSLTPGSSPLVNSTPAASRAVGMRTASWPRKWRLRKAHRSPGRVGRGAPTCKGSKRRNCRAGAARTTLRREVRRLRAGCGHARAHVERNAREASLYLA
jgi:hypothetical protein